MSFTLARDALFFIRSELEKITQGKKSFGETVRICKIAMDLIDNIEQVQSQVVVDCGMKRLSSTEQYKEMMRYSHLSCAQSVASTVVKSDSYLFSDVTEDLPRDNTVILKTLFVLRQPRK